MGGAAGQWAIATGISDLRLEISDGGRAVGGWWQGDGKTGERQREQFSGLSGTSRMHFSRRSRTGLICAAPPSTEGAGLDSRRPSGTGIDRALPARRVSDASATVTRAGNGVKQML